jgi:ABC-type uncharacterized transport system auxiliary subunit
MIRKYYVLDAQVGVNLATLGLSTPLPFKVGIRDFRVAKAFDQTSMAVRTASHEVNYYAYHLWAVRPGVAIAELMNHLINQSGLFQSCSLDYMPDVDYILTGTVDQIERSQEKGEGAAHVRATLDLIDVKTELPVLQHPFDRQSELKKKKDANQLAETISELLRQETEAFIREMAAYFQPAETP